MEQQVILLHLKDGEWPYDGITHTRQIARGIVVDEEGDYHFVQVEREDEFGTGTFIETAGGGVEEGEELPAALLRELREELGAEVEILGEIGIVEDDYHLIHRHNVSHYFLCKAVSFGAPQYTPEETRRFCLSPVKLTYEEAILAYEKAAENPLGRLLANRELPILRQAKQRLEEI